MNDDACPRCGRVAVERLCIRHTEEAHDETGAVFSCSACDHEWRIEETAEEKSRWTRNN